MWGRAVDRGEWWRGGRGGGAGGFVVQAGKVGECLQRREELEHLGLGSAPAVVRIALELLGQPARMGEDTLRGVSEGLPPHVEAASREAPRNARTVLQLVLRAGHTRAWVRGRRRIYGSPAAPRRAWLRLGQR